MGDLFPAWLEDRAKGDIVGIARKGALEFFGRDGTFDPVPFRLMAVYWGLVLLMPLGMLIAAASWLGVATTMQAVVAASLMYGFNPKDARKSVYSMCRTHPLKTAASG